MTKVRLPYSIDNYLIPRHLKLTTRHLEAEYSTVKILYAKGEPIRNIVRLTTFSRRMIQFIIFPERALLAKQNFARRQKDGRYKLPTKEQSARVQATRNRKRILTDKILIKK